LGEFFILASGPFRGAVRYGFVLEKAGAEWNWNEKRAENPHVSVGVF
jgi:hypothetical protein